MSEAATEDRFTLEAPPKAAYVATARMFASAVARQAGLNEEHLDDVKLAVSEACARALAASDADQPLSVVARRTGEQLVFEIAQWGVLLTASRHLSVDEPTPTPAELAAGVSLELISALFEDADVVAGEGGEAVLRFSVQVA